MAVIMSKTREKFLSKKKERKATRKREKEYGERIFFCRGLRDKRGQLVPCKFEVMPTTKSALTATCRRCRTAHVKVEKKYGKELEWLTVLQAETRQQQDDEAHEKAFSPGEYGMDKPEHEGDCDYKDFDLGGLRKTNRTMLMGKGRTGMGTCWIDRMGRPVHWCRQQKRVSSGSERGV